MTPRLGVRLIGTCHHCRTPVYARHRNRMYCSRACAQAAYRYRLWRAEEGLQTEEELDRLIERRRVTMPADK